MNFSPDNRATLENLLSALRSGMDGGQAYGILADTLGAQQQQTAQRQEKMQGYAGTLMDLAGQGMPLDTTRSIMDLLTPKPGVPGGVENMIGTIYPTPEQYAPPTGMAAGQPMPYSDYVAAQDPAQIQSPVYTENPAVQQQQFENALAMQPPPPTAGEVTQSTLGNILQATQILLAQGMSPEEAVSFIGSDPKYAGVLAQNLPKVIAFINYTQGQL